MKKTKISLGVLTLLFATLFIASCGGGNTQNDENSENIEQNSAAYDTEYSTLTYNSSQKKYYKDKDETELFTGTAGEKNSSDQLITLATIKNGFLVTKKVWTDFGGELILTEDMEYKDGELFNGWHNEIEKDKLFIVTMSYRTYTKGKATDFWVIEEGSGLYSGRPAKLNLNDEILCESEKKTSVFSYLEYKNSEGLHEYYQHAVNFIDCAKSKNLKNFHIYINE